MKFRGSLLFSFLIVTFLVAAFQQPRVDSAQKEAVLMRTILSFMGQLHFQPKEVDDQFSQELYDLYLDGLDGDHRLLTKQDLKQLEPYRKQLDDQVQVGDYEFFEISLELVTASLEKTQTMYREILAEPFNFNEKEEIELDADKRGYAKNDQELREYWRRYLKYQTLLRLNEKLENQEEAGEEVAKQSYEELEQEAREDVLEVFDGYYERLFKIKREDRLSYYLNSVTHLFDPHSDYLQPFDKEQFTIRFSGRLEGIGARLQSDGDYTKVVDIVVGGPAWKGKELTENDVIVKVAQDGEEPVDITGMGLDDVVQLIRGPKGTKVTLTVKKVDGTMQKVTIVRDVVILEEGFAKSLILDGVEADERIGYIYLPRFYADWENPDGRFCSDDVAREIEKLKEEKVDGIILDLRNNGGGSLPEVVEMSGLFIEKGPIVQVKSRERNPEVMSDMDPQVQYNGPLVVMVNSLSASASEILAAALQDYGRAVIVGSKSTYGKGTVQRFYNLDRVVRGLDDIKPLGEIKLTTQKFYRINGGSTQLRGVEPDIVLPDEYHFIKTGEREQDYPMEWTEIAPVDFEQNVYRVRGLDQFQTSSQERIQSSPVFSEIYEEARRLKEQRDESSYSLRLEDFQQMMEYRELKSQEFSNLFDSVVIPGVTNLETDLPSIHADESKKARNDDWIKMVSKDVYIRETLHVMHDMLTLK